MFKEIQKLYKKGYKVIVCVDEAGRGSLAGPVLACAVSFRKGLSLGDLNLSKFKNIRDSKNLSEKQREKWFRVLIDQSDLEWAVAKVSEKVIDRINILEASKLAMYRAVKKLEDKLMKKNDKKTKKSLSCNNNINLNKIDYLIIDGNIKLIPPKHLGQRIGRLKSEVRQKAIPKADEKIFLCAVASVIAKVQRDRIMNYLDKKYPQYGFSKHKGYGTKEHLAALKKYGPCEFHRKSFRPIKDLG